MIISTTPPRRRALRRTVPLLAALSSLGVALAACGGGDDDGASAATNAPTTAAPTTTQPAAAGDSTPPGSAPADSTTDGSQPVAGEPDPLAYSQCMRDHGIANFPDPSAEGGLGVDAEALGIDPASPQFQAAEEACNYLMPPEDAAGPSQEGMEAMLAYAQCMRDEGVTAFPDPNSEGGLALDGDAVGIDTPQFAAADEACKHLLPGAGEGGSTNQSGQ
jgi:hypothetical protein